MDINDAFPSKYLRAGDDVPDDEVVVITIKDVRMEKLGQGTDVQNKPVIYCNEFTKGFVVNKTNATTIAKALQSEDTDDWIGKKIALFMMVVQGPNGMVPSIRVRSKVPVAAKTNPATGQPSRKPAPVLTQAEADAPADDNEIPY